MGSEDWSTAVTVGDYCFSYEKKGWFTGQNNKRCNRVKKNQLDAQLILSIFRKLYMFRAYLGPSSGGTTVCIQFLLIIRH